MDGRWKSTPENCRSARKSPPPHRTSIICLMPLDRHKLAIAAAILFSGTAVLAQSPACDETLWDHVCNPARLVGQQKCVTVTGTIVDATANQKTHRKDGVRHEPDGDIHGWLKLDPGQEKFLNAGNKTHENGNLVFEIVCLLPVSQDDAKAACTFTVQ